MNVALQRCIDRWLGVPICGMLTLLRWMVGRRGNRPWPPRQILFIQLPEAGSLALASPTVRRVRELFPEARLHFLVFARNREFLELLDLIAPEDIWTLDDRTFGRFCVSVWRFFRQARSRGIDTTLDLDLFARASMILACLSGARNRVGFDNYRAEGLYRGRLLTHPVSYNVYHHISANFWALAETLAQREPLQPAWKGRPREIVTLPRIAPDPGRVAAMRQRIVARCPEYDDSSRLVVLSPFSGNLLPIRAWPTEHYAVFVRQLLEADPSVVVLVIGLEEARAYCVPLFSEVQSPRLVDFIGQTRNIAEVLDLLDLAHLFVSADSGPPHFASLKKAPSIVFFGPECPMLYAPLGENIHTVYLGLHCSPCVSAFNHRDTPCTDNQCLRRIEPSDVLKLAQELLGSGQNSSS
ncbi:MAG TPA: glycosyltransferase family 9 protein [Candidatus Sumerlaeota bacterium]|nr:glycosyltransferase family 9 protein [Candidatus Sumerlaeota bacterium]